jgi:hypothetical protein
VASLFHALCEDVLDARLAHPAALGPLVPLASPPLTYPDNIAPPPPLAEIASRFDAPQTMYVPLDPNRHGGAA